MNWSQAPGFGTERTCIQAANRRAGPSPNVPGGGSTGSALVDRSRDRPPWLLKDSKQFVAERAKRVKAVSRRRRLQRDESVRDACQLFLPATVVQQIRRLRPEGRGSLFRSGCEYLSHLRAQILSGAQPWPPAGSWGSGAPDNGSGAIAACPGMARLWRSAGSGQAFFLACTAKDVAALGPFRVFEP